MAILLFVNAGAIAQQSNLGCSQTSVPFVNGTFSVTETDASSGLSAWATCVVNCATAPTPDKVIDANTTNFATGTIAASGSLQLAVTDAANTYNSGNFAGFVMSSSLLNLNALGSVTISTYLNGTPQESVAGGSLIAVNSSISGAYEIGFYTNKPFNRIQVSISAALGLGTYNVYYAFMRGTGSCTSLPVACNVPTRIRTTTYAAVVDPLLTSVTGALAVGAITNTGNLVDADTTNYASITTTLSVLGTALVAVKDVVTDYPAGYFAGFEIENPTLLNATLLGNITIATYKDGVFQQQQSGSGLALGATALGNSGRQTVGFVTTLAFDEVRLTVNQPASVSLGETRVYSAIFRQFCAGPSLVCNTPTALQDATYPAYVDAANTGITGAACVACAVTATGNLLDADTSNFSTITLTAGALVSGHLAVKDQVTDYPGGSTFAGFEISNPLLLNASVLGSITISVYRDGVFKQSATGTGLIASIPTFLSGGGGSRQRIGFLPDSTFDEVKISLIQTGANLGTTLVYGAILERYCAGPALACNTPTALQDNPYPVFIDGANTGLTGAACVSCAVTNTKYLIDGDTSNFATIDLTAGVIASGHVAVRDAITTYPAKTFAGFQLSNPLLADANVLSNVTVSVYRKGIFKQAVSGSNIIATVPTFLTGTGGGRQTLGFVADSSFDEVKLSVNQTVGVNLGITLVYSPVFETFCGAPVTCNAATYLNAPAQSVVVDQRQSGVTGVACVSCAVNNPGNVISADTTDYATLITTAGVLASSSIAVRDVVNTYPAGTIAGFNVRDPNNFLEVSLLKTLTISTYRNGSFVEARTAGQLLDLSALILTISTGGTGTGRYNIGFVATQPFDEIKISATPVAGVVPIVRVYGAFVDTRYLDTVTNGGSSSICAKPPVAEPDHSGTNVNTPVSASLRTNDRDPQTGILTYNTTPTVAPQHGTVTINSNGTYTYTPANGYIGADSFAYTVCNTAALCTTQWAYISVVPAPVAGGPNQAPIPMTDYSQTYVNRPVTGDAANNDIDPDGNGLTYTLATPPVHGTLAVAAGGTYTYTPDSSYIGNDTAMLTVCDNGTPSICRNSRVIIVVNPLTGTAATHPPYGQDDVFSTPAGTAATGNIRLNDSDPDGDTLTTSILTAVNPANGTLTIGSNGAFTFTPASGFIGTVTVPYQVCDATACDTAVLSIVVTPYIAAEPDHAVTNVNTPVSGNLSTNDRTPAGSTLTYNTTAATAPQHGAVTINANGTYTYTPAAGYAGQDSFAYTVCNTYSLCTTQWAYISVVPAPAPNGANQAPVPMADYSQTKVNHSVTGNAANNDVDPNGNGLTYTVASTTTHGTLVVAAGGAYTYTPAGNYVGYDTATLTVCNNGTPSLCGTSKLYILVTPDRNPAANHPPYAQDDVFGTVAGTPVTGNTRLNDSDPDGDAFTSTAIGTVNASTTGTLTFNSDGTFTFTPVAGFVGSISIPYKVCDASACDTATLAINIAPYITAEPDHAATNINTAVNGNLSTNDRTVPGSALTYNTATATAPQHGGVTINANGTYTYTPANGYTGIDSFAYTVCNTYSLCATQWAYIAVVPAPVAGGANLAPIPQADYSQTYVNIPVSGNAATNDIDPDGNILTYTVASPAVHGSLVVSANGAYTYTPANNYIGLDTATLTVCDGGSPSICGSSKVYLVVYPNRNPTANHAPFAQDDVFGTVAGIPVAGSTRLNDSDPDGDALTTTAIGTVNASTTGTLVINSDGTFLFTPVAGFAGSVSVPYRLCDASACDTATLTVTVSPFISTEPDNVLTNVNTAVSGDLSTNDRTVPGSTLTYNTTAAIAPHNGTVTINAAGTYTYTPSTNYTGPDSFAYTVCNSYSICATQWVYITVVPDRVAYANNLPPLPQSDYGQTYVNIPVSGQAADNDVEPDGNPTTYSIASNPSHGTLSLGSNGSYTYTPANGYIGNDTAAIQVCDNGTPSLCATSSLIIVVNPARTNPPNHPPFAQNDAYATINSIKVSGNVRLNDSDPDGDTLTTTVLDTVDYNNAGILQFHTDGTFTFSPVNGFTGTVSVRYMACDGNACDTATLTIDVAHYVGPDFTPTIAMDTFTFAAAGTARDFIIDVHELAGGPNVGPLVIRLFKASAFSLTYDPNATYANVGGGRTVYNSDWTFTETSTTIMMTLKPGANFPANGIRPIGFRATRKINIPTNTRQNITVAIPNGSAGDSNASNNQYSVIVTAQ